MDQLSQAIEDFTQQITSISSALIGITFVLSIIPYILFAVGLSSVANRYGLKHSWMAWLPIARKHLLTEIADLRRAQVGKHKKLETQFEIIACLILGCVYVVAKSNNAILIAILVILIAMLSFNQVFSYYYFYRLCDRENAPAYFLLGLLINPLNCIFVFHCR